MGDVPAPQKTSRMANKTVRTTADPLAFINTVDTTATRRADAPTRSCWWR